MFLSVILKDNKYQATIKCEPDEHPSEATILLKGKYDNKDDALLHGTKICDDMCNGISRPDAVEAWWTGGDDEV